jgi:hypothetical protein
MHSKQMLFNTPSRLAFFALQFCLVMVLAFASGCSKKTSTGGAPAAGATSRDPGYSSSGAQLKPVSAKKKGAAPATHEQKVAEFNARMKSNAKAKAKMAKEMEKPQYSDPSYFGHKKKPKKRPKGKRKFCKECGIVH